MPGNAKPVSTRAIKTALVSAALSRRLNELASQGVTVEEKDIPKIRAAIRAELRKPLPDPVPQTAAPAGLLALFQATGTTSYHRARQRGLLRGRVKPGEAVEQYLIHKECPNPGDAMPSESAKEMK